MSKASTTKQAAAATTVQAAAAPVASTATTAPVTTQAPVTTTATDATPAATAPAAAPAQAASTKASPKGGALGGCVLLPLGVPGTAHGAAIAAAAAHYPMGPAGAQALGAPLPYITGACSYLACAHTGHNPKGGKKAGAAGVWYNPATGQATAANGTPMVAGQAGPHNGYTAAAVAPLWAAIGNAVVAYHTAQGTPCPAWCAPAPVVAAPQVEVQAA